MGTAGRLEATRRDEETLGSPRALRWARRDGPLALFDAGIVFASYVIALVLRFEAAVPPEYWNRFLVVLPFLLLIHLASNFYLGLYGHIWKHASGDEVRRIAVAGAAAAAFMVVAGLFFERDRLLPISVILSGATLVMMGFAAVRFQSRLFARRARSTALNKTRLLVVGAGHASSMVLRDLVRNPASTVEVVGIVDDDPRKEGRRLHGVAVVGTRAAIPSLVRDLAIEEVLLAIPSATSEMVRETAALCESAGVRLRILPSVHEIVGGRVTARDIRDVQIEDLLGRQQVKIDTDAVEALIRGRRVLVTGAGGSIGAEIARQVAVFEPAGLVLLDHDETHLHDALLDVRSAIPALVDIRDRAPLQRLFERHRPEIVFHAAAHKHVPVLESHPDEAFKTNVQGTANLCDAALATGVGWFVLISTDKAVNPLSVMGASKRLAEQVVWSRLAERCVYCAVRFGNVLGSRGSVIPTFINQINKGGPVTVTDRSMTRYFMSVGEAVQLVTQAAAMARGGEIFTLNMGEAVNMGELAERVITLMGRRPGAEIQIEVIGARPGEKLHEDLSWSHEEVRPTRHPSIVSSAPDPPRDTAVEHTLRTCEDLVAQGRLDDLSAYLRRISHASFAFTADVPLEPPEGKPEEEQWSPSSI
ncbi:MAG: polysaccharide biosynthesis protein [Actinomycetota bacterium]